MGGFTVAKTSAASFPKGSKRNNSDRFINVQELTHERSCVLLDNRTIQVINWLISNSIIIRVNNSQQLHTEINSEHEK